MFPREVDHERVAAEELGLNIRALPPVYSFNTTRSLHEDRVTTTSAKNAGALSFGLIAAWIALCLIWGSTWLAIKIGLADLPPISFIAFRFVIAAAVLFAISLGRFPLPATRRLSPARHHRHSHVRDQLRAAFLGRAICLVRPGGNPAGDHSNVSDSSSLIFICRRSD